VIWSLDDIRVISCGMDGAVYEWEVLTGKRVGENVLKQCGYTGVAIMPDGKQLYAVGTDKMLKEMAESQVNISGQTNLH